MKLHQACVNILDQLASVVADIHEQDYCKAVFSLSGSSIGQHLRHTLEFFVCLRKGLATGTVNYDKREHDKLIETNKFTALELIRDLKNFVQTNLFDMPLKLEAGYNLSEEQFVTIETNYLRELVYNIEHAVHHMAIMKIGIREIAPYIQLPVDFGIAASTIRYQATGS